MGLVREPLDVDFVVDSKPLTQKEKEAVSQYIRAYKAKQAKKNTRKISSIRKKMKQPEGQKVTY
jgi:hypothetical protein